VAVEALLEAEQLQHDIWEPCWRHDGSSDGGPAILPAIRASSCRRSRSAR
jgi:hypothetical protein